MEALIWGGTAVSVAGLAGLVYCIFRVMRARRAGLSNSDLRSAVRKVVVLNMAALFVSVLGLMMVILGISLA